MKRHLASRPRNATRCFSSSARALTDRPDRNGIPRSHQPNRRADDFKDEAAGVKDGLRTNCEEESNVSHTAESVSGLDNPNVDNTFPIIDTPANTDADAPDFLKQLELFNKGESIKEEGIRAGSSGKVEGEAWRKAEHTKRSGGVPKHLDEKWRFLTLRDREKYSREAPLLSAMREKARTMQKEWAANQPPPSPTPSKPPQPPLLPEPPYTPPTSLPTARQLASLPQSPLLRPIPSFWSEKAYKMKSAPPEELTPFQRKLHRNPYALMLASPVRTCLITKQRLPRDFLLSFESLTNSEDGKAWFLPRDLSMPVPAKKLRPSKPQSPPPSDSTTASDNIPPTNAGVKTNTTQPPTNKPLRTGSRYYILSSSPLLSQLISPPKTPRGPTPRKSSYRNAWQILNRLEREKHSLLAADASWRPDMATFVLQLMRARATGLIWKGLFRGDKFVRYRDDWEQIVREKQLGAVLWMGREELLPEEPNGRDDSEEAKKGYTEAVRREVEWGPDAYTVVNNPPSWDRKVPVFNMLRLLGTEGVKEIRKRGPPLERRDFVVVRDKQDTVELRRWLAKIENYLAVFTGEEEGEEGRWTPRDDGDDAGVDVEFETVYVPEDRL